MATTANPALTYKRDRERSRTRALARPDLAAQARGADRAFGLLRVIFTVAPIAFGLDKFAGVLTNWEQYLAPWVDNLLPGTAHQAMLAVGVVEIFAGLLVAFAPRIGGVVVAAWLGGIIVNLLSMGRFYDIALRDFGLLAAALALSLLAAGRHRGARRMTEAT